MKHKYIIKDRLSDVVTLIQSLSLSNEDYSTNEDIEKKGNKKPLSSKTWNKIAEDHPEFFVISDNKIYLNYRFYDRRRMSTTETMSLVNNALAIHDKELSQRNKNSFLIPLYIAIFSTIFSTISLFYNTSKIEKSITKIIQNENKKNSDTIIKAINQIKHD